MEVDLRPMREGDREGLRRFLSLDPAANLYLLAALEAPIPDAGLWVAARGNAILGAIMRTGTAWLPGLPLPLWTPAFSHLDCADAFAQLMDRNPDGHILSGPASITEPIAARLPLRIGEAPAAFSLDSLKMLPARAPRGVERLAAGELGAVARLHADDEPGQTDWQRRWESIPRRIWVARNDAGEVVASAHTHVEIPGFAMIGGVYTRPDSRGEGRATACVTALCADLMREGKTPCLYHDREHSLYHRIGFAPHAKWALGRLAPRD